MLGPSEEETAPFTPRASPIARAGERPSLRADVWMGGALTPVGKAILPEMLRSAWVVDCAGDLPVAYREAAAAWLPCVFPDLEGHPVRFERLQEVVSQAAAAVRSGELTGLYVFCQQGLNRSGLLTGLLLGELGFTGEEALARILNARPGAFSNQAFRRLVAG
ncbi:MAG: hypothetical protein ACR2HN_05215 [Tepidiformaceae bacterium]